MPRFIDTNKIKTNDNKFVIVKNYLYLCTSFKDESGWTTPQ